MPHAPSLAPRAFSENVELGERRDRSLCNGSVGAELFAHENCVDYGLPHKNLDECVGV